MQNIKQNNKDFLLNVLFFSSLWGLSEAVLGYVLHFLPDGIPGYIMYPIGVFFMVSLYNKTEKINAVFLCGILAASIKLIDFLFPIMHYVKVLNPGLSIIFESLSIIFAIKIFKTKKIDFKFIFTASLLWRILYILFSLILLRVDSTAPNILFNGFFTENVLNFLLKDTLINILVIIGVYKIFQNFTIQSKLKNFQLHIPVVSGVLFLNLLAEILIKKYL